MGTTTATKTSLLSKALNYQFFKRFLTERKAAELFGVSPHRLTAVLDGTEVIDDEFAGMISFYIGKKPPGFWLDLQKRSGLGEYYPGSKYAADLLRGAMESFRYSINDTAVKLGISVHELEKILDAEIVISKVVGRRLKTVFGGKGGGGWENLGNANWKFSL